MDYGIEFKFLPDFHHTTHVDNFPLDTLDTLSCRQDTAITIGQQPSLPATSVYHLPTMSHSRTGKVRSHVNRLMLATPQPTFPQRTFYSGPQLTAFIPLGG